MLEERILRDIADVFVYIRFHAYEKDFMKLKEQLLLMEEKRALVNHFGTDFQKEIFAYCFDNLKLSIESEQDEFTADFADAVHNLPEIFYKEYNLKAYWKLYIRMLKDKHGKHYFNDFKHVFKGMNNEIQQYNLKSKYSDYPYSKWVL
jgi:hypothetical protein